MYMETILILMYHARRDGDRNKGRKGRIKPRIIERILGCVACSTRLKPNGTAQTPNLTHIDIVVGRAVPQTHCTLSQAGSCKKAHSTLLPVYQSKKKISTSSYPQLQRKRQKHTCNNGCPATILRKRSSPSLLLSITSSEKRLVNTFPGSAGIFTRVDSCSRISRNASKSE